MTSRIIVADDHPLFREAMVRTVCLLLPRACVAEAGSLDEVLQMASVGEALDTLILDLRFPGLDSVNRLAQLKRQLPRTTLIVVSMVDDPVIIDQVMACGVDGFIGKSLSAEQMSAAILAVQAGEVLVRYLPSGLLPVAKTDSGTEHLTQRQQDVLRLIAQGKTNKEIAKALDISPFTVRIHVSSLLKALNVSSRTAAAVKYSAG